MKGKGGKEGRGAGEGKSEAEPLGPIAIDINFSPSNNTYIINRKGYGERVIKIIA